MSKKSKEKKAPEKEEEKAPQSASTSSPTSMDELTSNETLPQVQEHSIAAVLAEKNEAKNEDGFDPEIHATNDDGTPKKKKDGSFAKKRGRKSVLNTGEKSEKQKQKELEEEKAKIENRQSAIVISQILEQAQIKFISEEFAYSDKERAANQAVWEATLEYYGGVNIPPPVALAMDHMTIILARANQPKTKDKFAHIKVWFKNKFKRDKKHALPDNRKNTEREDNVREEESA